MTPRERELAAIRREPTDRVATDAICVENQPAIAELLGLPADQVLDALGLDGRIVGGPYRGTVRQAVDGVGFTEWGTPNTGDYGTARSYPLADVADLAAIERYPWPQADDYDFAAASANAAAMGQKYALRGPYWQPLFCRVCDLVGMEAAMMRMLCDPKSFEAILDRVFQHTFECVRRLLEACGDDLPILCLGDDFATQRGLMMAPEHWRRFLKPRFAKLFALGKERGKSVWFHSCGDVTAVLPDLIDIGVDVWETVQLHTLPMSPTALKREYGKHLTFFGGVNTQRLPFIGPDEVRREVRQRIDVLGEGGGYICGPDHHIKPDVSPEVTAALFEAARTYGDNG